MIILIGESGCGKSTVADILTNKFGYQKIISYTTRPIRPSETNGVDYHFITDEEFNNLKANGFFIESASYNGWQYGTAYDDFKDSYDKIAILTPHGLRNIKKVNDEVFSVYINVPRKDRLIKILERGDNIEETYRRSLSDVGMFDGIEDEVDLIINNEHYQKSAEDIAKIITIKYQSKLMERGINY